MEKVGYLAAGLVILIFFMILFGTPATTTAAVIMAGLGVLLVSAVILFVKWMWR